MTKLKKLGPIEWTRETTLSSLWQAWMDLNGFVNDRQAALAITQLGIRGGTNISKWLQDEPTTSLLSTSMKEIIEKTGVDIDGWLVAEAKRLVIAENPELESRLPFNKITSRKEVIDELETWSKLYGGNLYLALQMRIPPGQTSHYMQRTHQPSLEILPSILRGLAQGFISIDCQEDIGFILTCRAIMGGDPEEFFPNVTNFKTAIDELLKPFKGYQDKKIENETGIHHALIHDLRTWKPVSGKRGMVPESIEKILRVLVIRKYPYLGDAFDENRAVYRKNEHKGILEVPVPLKVLINKGQPKPIETKKDPTPKSKANAPKTEKQAPPMVSLLEAVENVVQAPPTQTSGQSVTDVLADMYAEMSTRLRALPKPAPVHTDARDVGATIDNVRHCLDQKSWKQRKGVRLTASEIENVRTAIEQLRAIFVGISELDPDYIRTVLSPVFGPELFELFIAGEGLKHLLETHGAWQVMMSTRETAQLLRKRKEIQ